LRDRKAKKDNVAFEIFLWHVTANKQPATNDLVPTFRIAYSEISEHLCGKRRFSNVAEQVFIARNLKPCSLQVAYLTNNKCRFEICGKKRK